MCNSYRSRTGFRRRVSAISNASPVPTILTLVLELLSFLGIYCSNSLNQFSYPARFTLLPKWGSNRFKRSNWRRLLQAFSLQLSSILHSGPYIPIRALQSQSPWYREGNQGSEWSRHFHMLQRNAVPNPFFLNESCSLVSSLQQERFTAIGALACTTSETSFLICNRRNLTKPESVSFSPRLAFINKLYSLFEPITFSHGQLLTIPFKLCMQLSFRSHFLKFQLYRLNSFWYRNHSPLLLVELSVRTYVGNFVVI